ncbi:hypothetical protein [Flavobacterium sp. WC2509]|uniref:hypothetical protein n=1 Tax=Flavobacterium sp. WC2509 TaxID=3461406 RepID=UPI004043F9AD
MRKLKLIFTLLTSIILFSSCTKNDDNPTDNIPTDNIPTNNTPTNNTPTDNVPTNNIPTNNIPTNNIPTNNIPTNNTPTDNTPTNSGKLIINGVEKNLTKGFIKPNYTGTDVTYDSRRFYIILTNDEVTIQNNNFIYSDKITQLIDFNMYCSSLNPGSVQYTTYNVKNSHTNVNFNDPFIDHTGINKDVVIKNGALVSKNSLSSDDMTSGQTSISYNNGIYTINFSFSNAQNNITGTYTGVLTKLNFQY